MKKDILIQYYPNDILKMMRDNYTNKKRTNLIENGFTFDKFVLKAYELGYLNSDSHQIRRIDTQKPFSENNMMLKSADGLLHKLKNMSKIIKTTERHKVAIKIK